MSKFEERCIGIILESSTPLEYPLGATDKGKEAIDRLNKAVEDKMILNQAFQDVKSRLNRNVEDITQNSRTLSDRTYKTIYEFSSSGLPWDLNGVKKAVKELQVVKNVVNPPTNLHFRENFKEADFLASWPTIQAEMKEYLKTLESWLPVVDRLKEVKLLVVKGRQPNPNAIPAFEPRRADPNTEKIVIDVLNKLAAPLKPQVIDKLAKQDEAVVKQFLDSGKEPTHQNIWMFYKNDIEKMSLVDMCLNASNRAIVPDYAAKLRAKATREVDDMVARFIAKNVEKIAPLLARKEGSEAKVLHGNLDGIGFSGEISFKFKDNTSFIVRNKVVMKWTARQQQFLQFPTTFHDVVFPDGSKKAMQSEEQMHKEWLS